jgi:hypothetical protein
MKINNDRGPVSSVIDMLKKKCKSTKNEKTAAAPWVSLPRCAKQTNQINKNLFEISLMLYISNRDKLVHLSLFL